MGGTDSLSSALLYAGSLYRAGCPNLITKRSKNVEKNAQQYKLEEDRILETLERARTDHANDNSLYTAMAYQDYMLLAAQILIGGANIAAYHDKEGRWIAPPDVFWSACEEISTVGVGNMHDIRLVLLAAYEGCAHYEKTNKGKE